MTGTKTPLAVLRDYIERSTHWQEGGADRHAALYVALPALEEMLSMAVLELTAGIGYVDSVTMKKNEEVSYETMQRSGFRRKDGWSRKYSLADARKDASAASIRLRNAWEILDPCNAERTAKAVSFAKSAQSKEALGNFQNALQEAISHLQAVLNTARTHAEQQAADTAARDWLLSIGSEPS